MGTVRWWHPPLYRLDFPCRTPMSWLFLATVVVSTVWICWSCESSWRCQRSGESERVQREGEAKGSAWTAGSGERGAFPTKRQADSDEGQTPRRSSAYRGTGVLGQGINLQEVIDRSGRARGLVSATRSASGRGVRRTKKLPGQRAFPTKRQLPRKPPTLTKAKHQEGAARTLVSICRRGKRGRGGWGASADNHGTCLGFGQLKAQA